MKKYVNHCFNFLDPFNAYDKIKNLLKYNLNI